MEKALPGIIGAIVVGYLVIMAIAAVVIVGLMVASTVAAILTSSFVLSSLYSFNHKHLGWADYQRIGWYSYAAHGVLWLILSLTVVSFGYGQLWQNVAWSAFWPFALIVTFEDGLFGLRENSFVVAGSFFFTCLVVSYTVSYYKYSSEQYDDPVVRRKMYRSGLAYFFAATLIPAYFLGGYVMGFIAHKPFTDASVHEAYEQSKTTPKRSTVYSYDMNDLGLNRRLTSPQETRYRYWRDARLDLRYFAPGQDGRWAFYSTYSGGDWFHQFFSFETGRHQHFVQDYLDGAVRSHNLRGYFGPYGKAAILHDMRKSGHITFVDLETFRRRTIHLNGSFDFEWHNEVWLVDDIEALIDGRKTDGDRKLVELYVRRGNDQLDLALFGRRE